MKQPYNSLLLAGIFSSLIIPLNLQADSDVDVSDDALLDLSLEELISLDVPDVTSVSKRKQRLMDSAAAVYVITDEDIQRSGVTSIPDALRMVPGMQVAKLNGNTWAISTRGFNYIFANKLLVLIDGRTVYSPLFSGVNWDVQDTMLEDIARIEVIRGPGAALWGANAVNGVINIITKHAADTQGGLLSAGFGSEEKAFTAYRYGGKISDDAFYRIYVKTFDRDGMANSDGTDANDNWHMRRAGFKTDWQSTDNAHLSFQGDIYRGSTRPPLSIFDPNEAALGEQTYTNKDRDQKGGNISALWKKTTGDNENYSIHAVYDNYQNFDYRITEKRDTFDLEFEHGFKPRKNHDLVWGLSYRATWYEVDATEYMYLIDGSSRQVNQLYSGFIQDHITLSDQWALTLSSRFEHNDFTDYEIQPNARMTWKPTENRTFWSAISRAVKTPSISETALQTKGISFVEDGNNEYQIPISGNPDLTSEELISFELGYREAFSDTFRLDTTVFFNDYKDILAYVGNPFCPNGTPTTGPICLPPSNPVQVPTILSNGINAKSYGLEIIADWQAKPWWKLQFTYSWFNIEAKPNKEKSEFLSRNEEIIETLAASNTANIRSSMNLPNQWYLDLWIRYMDNLKNAKVGAYTALDMRIAKKFGEDLEVSLVGQNLFDNQRLEFDEIFSGLSETEVQESWYLQLRWHY